MVVDIADKSLLESLAAEHTTVHIQMDSKNVEDVERLWEMPQFFSNELVNAIGKMYNKAIKDDNFYRIGMDKNLLFDAIKHTKKKEVDAIRKVAVVLNEFEDYMDSYNVVFDGKTSGVFCGIRIADMREIVLDFSDCDVDIEILLRAIAGITDKYLRNPKGIKIHLVLSDLNEFNQGKRLYELQQKMKQESLIIEELTISRYLISEDYRCLNEKICVVDKETYISDHQEFAEYIFSADKNALMNEHMSKEVREALMEFLNRDKETAADNLVLLNILAEISRNAEEVELAWSRQRIRVDCSEINVDLSDFLEGMKTLIEKENLYVMVLVDGGKENGRNLLRKE